MTYSPIFNNKIGQIQLQRTIRDCGVYQSGTTFTWRLYWSWLHILFHSLGYEVVKMVGDNPKFGLATFVA
ncbi:hypothetical protein AQUCO_01600414v1 [Aquilegia coerulea]|uniref:Uncharacterized protein n=1 Tax=Aquilegia coerulea TaxID=218851 RepID=A0A2G5DRG8_AQUCA|nr:hypothetical protein AQUCO_01600414v1 [Aquilegia coerulea]